jgi:hypothetical protein
VAVLLAVSLALGAMQSDGTSVPQVTEAPPPEPEYYAVYDNLAWCESTGRWHIYNPPYYGGLQMDMTFWRRHGGLQYASRPDLASRAEQIAVAIVGQSIQGWRAWPVCSRVVGLR